MILINAAGDTLHPTITTAKSCTGVMPVVKYHIIYLKAEIKAAVFSRASNAIC